MTDFWYLGLLVVVIFLMNPIITLIHELGHAIPALLFTKNNTVEIFVNSYSYENQTIKFKIGRLQFYVKYNYNILKTRGLCRLQEPLPNFNKNLIFIIGGPLINLITAIIIFCFVYFIIENKIFIFIVVAFIYISISVFFINLIPRKFISKDGKTHKTDGKRLLELFKQRKIKRYAKNGDVFFFNKEYKSALTEYQKCFKLGFNPHSISIILFDIYINLKRYEEIEKLIIPKIENNIADVNDFYFFGYALIMKKDFEKAIYFAQHALTIEEENEPALNMLGYCLIEIGHLEEAEPHLFKVSGNNGKVKPFALNNLGYIKLMQEDLESGITLIDKSLAIDKTNSYTYRNRGIYYFKKEKFILAKQDFEKAKELEPNTLHLDEWMKKLPN